LREMYVTGKKIVKPSMSEKKNNRHEIRKLVKPISPSYNLIISFNFEPFTPKDLEHDEK